jgi:hypothetical protein
MLMSTIDLHFIGIINCIFPNKLWIKDRPTTSNWNNLDDRGESILSTLCKLWIKDRPTTNNWNNLEDRGESI